MWPSIRAVILAVVAASSAAPALAQRGKPDVRFDGQSIDAMVAEFMHAQRIPGMTLAIVQAPYITRVVGYGIADVDKRRLASPHTLWPIGEMRHAYSAVAAAQLVEAGRLTFDDTLGSRLAGLPAAWQAVTLRQLVAHTSGVPDYRGQLGSRAGETLPAAQAIALVRELPLRFASGSGVGQSATDTVLLDMLIERAGGVRYADFVARHQIDALALRRTVFARGLAAVPQEALTQADVRHGAFLRDRRYIDPAEAAVGNVEHEGRLRPVPLAADPDALLASAEDISLWDIGLAGELLVERKENRDLLYTSARLNDGTPVPTNAGWRFTAHKGFMDISGQDGGSSCYLSRFTDASELVCVTLCANKAGVDLTELARRIAGAFDRRLGPPPMAPGMAALESSYPVATTVERLASFLRARGIEVVARIDHAAAAKGKGLALRPTEVLVFGNPAVGTALMQSRGSVAFDLPLRVLVWQEENGTVWAGYPDIAELASRHGVAGQSATVDAMRSSLAAALAHATRPF